jgi:ferredoxin
MVLEMKKNISRRSFLKTGFMAAGSFAATSVISPPRGMAASTRELCTLIDISKCIGCEECVYACREVNTDKFPNP